MADVQPKSYLHDKTMLLLVSFNFFLAFLAILVIVLRLFSTSGTYITQYRSQVGIGAFTTGGISEFIYLSVFAAAVVAFHLYMSIRVYNLRRQFAVILLGMSSLLLLILIIVSNGLLVLR